MTLARAYLLIGAVVFIGLGLMFLVSPVHWASTVEIPLPTATARTDVRATYGGFNLALGVFLALCALRADWIRPGLVAMGLVSAGFGGGRILGMLMEGTGNRLMVIFALIEVTSAALAFYLLRRLPGS